MMDCSCNHQTDPLHIQLEVRTIKYLVEGLNEGDFTKPVKVESNEGSIYRILNVAEKINSHTANLDLDYDFFKLKH